MEERIPEDERQLIAVVQDHDAAARLVVRLDEINAASDPIGSVYNENQTADQQLREKGKHTAAHITRKLNEAE